MIKRCLSFILFAAIALSMTAETHYKPHITIGVHGGASLSKISFSPSVKQNWENGITGGLSVKYAEERLVGILAELNFVQRGWRENFEDSPLKYGRKISYLALPIMTHIYFGPSRVKCFFNLGPEFCLMLSENTSANFDVESPTQSSDWPSDPRMTEQLTMPVKNKFDYGITAGFGCEFWLTPRNSAYIEGRYYYGLGNIFSATKADTFGASRNMTLMVTLGYNFRLK